MFSAHVFTVDPTTFNIHLNYMFAGTGAGRGETGEPEQKGALADILGVRPGDNILFYVTGYGFYGFFKAKQSENNNIVFYEPPTNQYLNTNLDSKTLTYRLFIERSRYGVYRFGIKEWDAIENPKNIEDKSVLKMQWAWIFKKLKGRRGCTAIPKEEFTLLKKMIIVNNERLEDSCSYRFSGGEVFPSNNLFEYHGDTTVSPVLSGNIRKIEEEADLRILFSSKAGVDKFLDEVLNATEYGQITYISNETKCSFGMKSMDLFFLTDQKKCILIELKNKFVNSDSIVEQIAGYARWVSSYKKYLKEIVPILIIKEPHLYSESGRGWKFKHLSRKDFQEGIISPWYRNELDKLQDMKSKFRDHKIDKLSQLKVYAFHTKKGDILQSFSPL